MIVDYIENYFDASGVQTADHLELLDRVLGDAGGDYGDFGGEETEGVVTPVVGLPFVREMAIVQKMKWTGTLISTAVTPSSCKCLIVDSAARPA